MARYLVEVEGPSIDTEELPYWFPNGEIHAIVDDGSVRLTGPALDRAPGPVEAQALAAQALDEFSACITLLWPAFVRPTLGAVIHENDAGERSRHALLSGTASGRSKARGKLSGPAGVMTETHAQTLLQGSRQDSHLRAALLLWADPLRTWPRLYRILEEVEQSLTQKVSDAGFATNAERRRFTHTANSAEVAGADARHAQGLYASPTNPMTLQEATAFISRILMNALEVARQTAGIGAP